MKLQASQRKFQTTPFRLYANCMGRQTTRLRFITRIIYSLSPSLLQEEEHCCRPSSAYINLFHRLYSFYCANDLLRRNLLWKHNSTSCCCLRCQRLLVIKDGHRSSTAVNMTSVWKRSINSNSRHVLYQFLPPKTAHSYNTRPRHHNFSLIEQSTNLNHRDFFIRHVI